MECGVRSVKYKVWSVECTVKCGVWSAECGVESVECGVWSVKWGVWSVECKVWSEVSSVRSVPHSQVSQTLSGLVTSKQKEYLRLQQNPTIHDTV